MPPGPAGGSGTPAPLAKQPRLRRLPPALRPAACRPSTSRGLCPVERDRTMQSQVQMHEQQPTSTADTPLPERPPLPCISSSSAHACRRLPLSSKNTHPHGNSTNARLPCISSSSARASATAWRRCRPDASSPACSATAARTASSFSCKSSSSKQVEGGIEHACGMDPCPANGQLHKVLTYSSGSSACARCSSHLRIESTA